jgi:hypothetical protein
MTYVFQGKGHEGPDDEPGARWTLDELVDLYVDEFPDPDELPDPLTADDLRELDEVFGARECLVMLEGVPALNREDTFRSLIQALPVGGTLQIEAELTLKRTE